MSVKSALKVTRPSTFRSISQFRPRTRTVHDRRLSFSSTEFEEDDVSVPHSAEPPGAGGAGGAGGAMAAGGAGGAGPGTGGVAGRSGPDRCAGAAGTAAGTAKPGGAGGAGGAMAEGGEGGAGSSTGGVGDRSGADGWAGGPDTAGGAGKAGTVDGAGGAGGAGGAPGPGGMACCGASRGPGAVAASAPTTLAARTNTATTLPRLLAFRSVDALRIAATRRWTWSGEAIASDVAMASPTAQRRARSMRLAAYVDGRTPALNTTSSVACSRRAAARRAPSHTTGTNQ